MDDDKKNNLNTDKETILRLRDALNNMNKDYMQTKLELDKIRGQQTQTQSQSRQPDLGSHLFKFSSKVRAFQSNVNTKFAAAIQSRNNNDNNDDDIDDNTNANGNTDAIQQQQQQQQKDVDNTQQQKQKQIRRLREDIESLSTHNNELQLMLKRTMEQKDLLFRERNELQKKNVFYEESIKNLREQSNKDMNQYELLLESFKKENNSQIEIEKKKLYCEYDEKIIKLNNELTENKKLLNEFKIKWDDNQNNWNNKLDLVIAERNSLKRKVKSLQNELNNINASSLNNKVNNNNNNNNNDDDIEIEMKLKKDKKKKITKQLIKSKMKNIKLKNQLNKQCKSFKAVTKKANKISETKNKNKKSTNKKTKHIVKRNVSDSMKRYVAAEQEWKCGHCGDALKASFEIDHILALCDGGTNHKTNLIALCRNCHGEKTIKERLFG